MFIQSSSITMFLTDPCSYLLLSQFLVFIVLILRAIWTYARRLAAPSLVHAMWRRCSDVITSYPFVVAKESPTRSLLSRDNLNLSAVVYSWQPGSYYFHSHLLEYFYHRHPDINLFVIKLKACQNMIYVKVGTVNLSANSMHVPKGWYIFNEISMKR